LCNTEAFPGVPDQPSNILRRISQRHFVPQ
jgi:hypothetical protein